MFFDEGSQNKAQPETSRGLPPLLYYQSSAENPFDTDGTHRLLHELGESREAKIFLVAEPFFPELEYLVLLRQERWATRDKWPNCGDFLKHQNSLPANRVTHGPSNWLWKLGGSNTWKISLNYYFDQGGWPYTSGIPSNLECWNQLDTCIGRRGHSPIITIAHFESHHLEDGLGIRLVANDPGILDGLTHSEHAYYQTMTGTFSETLSAMTGAMIADAAECYSEDPDYCQQHGIRFKTDARGQVVDLEQMDAPFWLSVYGDHATDYKIEKVMKLLQAGYRLESLKSGEDMCNGTIRERWVEGQINLA